VPGGEISMSGAFPGLVEGRVSFCRLQKREKGKFLPNGGEEIEEGVQLGWAKGDKKETCQLLFVIKEGGIR